MLRFSSWRGVFLTLALLGLLMLVTVFFGLRETLPEETRRTGRIGETVATFHTLVHDRVFVGYALAAGLAFGALFSYISGSPFVLENIYGVSPQSFGWFFGANALGLVTATQLGARVVHRVGSRRVLATGLLMSAAGGLLVLAAVVARTGLLGILPGLFLTVSSIGLIVPNATALALADYRATAGSASALLGLAQYIIGAVAAPFVGIGGSHAALPMGVVIAIMGTGALLRSSC